MKPIHAIWTTVMLLWPCLHGQMYEESRSLDDCLHRYLEKDFANLEMAIGTNDFIDNDSGRSIPTSEATMEIECSNFQSMLSCYGNVDDVKDERLYARLFSGLQQMYYFVCEGEVEQYTDFLGGIQCAMKLSTQQFCSQHGIVKNKWQKLLRLELGTDICQYLVTEQRCLLETMPFYCHKRAIYGYNTTMTIVTNNWCPKTDVGVIITPTASLITLISTVTFFTHFLP